MNDLQGPLFELEALPEEKVMEKELITYERRKPSDKSSHAGRNPSTEYLPAEENTILHPPADPNTMIHIGYAVVKRPKSRMRKAIEYTLKRLDKLTRYADTYLLDPDINLVEKAISPVAIGRKNFMFAGSHDAAQHSAMFYSLLGTCKALGIEPFAWLSDVLRSIPTHLINRIKELLPQYYKA